MSNKDASLSTLQTYDSVESARTALESGAITSVDLVKIALQKTEQYSGLNLFITLDKAGSLAAAETMDILRQRGEILGPLHGIPIVVKDNIFVAGLPNTAGTPSLDTFVPESDAGVIQQLKAAGAIVLGKTNMHELAYGITSNNYAFGAVGNARDADCIAGGSSGGTAAAIALGISTIGLGTDTGGSSRIPSALNGIAGFRPTTGRYSETGLVRISNTRDTVGPMAQKVKDIILLDSILSSEPDTQESISLKGLRIGVPRSYFYQGLSADTSRHIEHILSALTQAEVELVEADFNGLQELNEKVGFPLVLFETGRLLPEFLSEYLPETSVETLIENIASPDVKPIIQATADGDISEQAYRQALDVFRPQLQQLYQDYFFDNNVDAVIFPTTPLAAVPVKNSLDDVQIGEQTTPVFATFIRNTDPASNAGIPGLTIPAPAPEGQMPVGIEIDGPEGSDRRLLAIGAAIEALISQQNLIGES